MESSGKRFGKWLPVDLTRDELLEKGRLLSERHQELGAIEAEKKQVVLGYGEQIKDIKGEITSLAKCICTKQESREVECEECFNYSEKTVTVRRLDTMEDISRRAMTQEEQQTKLF